jgi:hypothetical protein
MLNILKPFMRLGVLATIATMWFFDVGRGGQRRALEQKSNILRLADLGWKSGDVARTLKVALRWVNVIFDERRAELLSIRNARINAAYDRARDFCITANPHRDTIINYAGPVTVHCPEWKGSNGIPIAEEPYDISELSDKDVCVIYWNQTRCRIILGFIPGVETHPRLRERWYGEVSMRTAKTPEDWRKVRIAFEEFGWTQ